MDYMKLIITVTICLLQATHADKLPTHSFQSFTNGHIQTHSILTPNTDLLHSNFLEEKSTVPKTKFLCDGKRGYFADIEADCKVFHICGPGNTQYDFFCSPGTLFNQKFAICDWSYNVNCQMSPKYFFLNNLAGDAQYRSDDQSIKENMDPPTEWLEPPSPKTAGTDNPPNTINSAAHTDHQTDHRSSKSISFESSFQELKDKEEDIVITEIDHTTGSHLLDGDVALHSILPVTLPHTTSTTLIEKEVQTADGGTLRRRQYKNTSDNVFTGKATSHVRQSSGFLPVIPEETKTYQLTPAVLVSSVEESKDPETGVRYRKWRREESKNSLKMTPEGGSNPLLTLKPEKPKWVRKDAVKSPDNWNSLTVNSLSNSDSKPQAKQSVGKFVPLLRLRPRNRIQKPKLFSPNEKNFSVLKAVSVNALSSKKGDWSMKLNENEFESDFGIPNDSKIVLPLQPTVPIPQVTEETEIEYTEDLDAPLPPSGPETIPDYEEINDVEILKYLTGSEKDQVELTSLPAFKSTQNIGRTPRVYKIKNKGFRPLTIKQKLKNGDGEDIIDLITRELNLTHSPFSIRLIQIDDPYADRYNAQLYENMTVIENGPSVVEADISSNAEDELDMFGQDSSDTYIIVHKFNETISQNLTKTNGSTSGQSNVLSQNFTKIIGSTPTHSNTSISTSTPIPINSSTMANITSTNTTTKSIGTQITSTSNTTTVINGTTTAITSTLTPSITTITGFSPRFYSRSRLESQLRLTRKNITNSHK